VHTCVCTDLILYVCGLIYCVHRVLRRIGCTRVYTLIDFTCMCTNLISHVCTLVCEHNEKNALMQEAENRVHTCVHTDLISHARALI